ncbi:MAG TPA: polyprenyl diphosphate synthase [Candidatus Nanopelagicales bacterium]|nr:polyprenyl diphosphate synthase [Candidatus Nanopelagicales bacterium]
MRRSHLLLPGTGGSGRITVRSVGLRMYAAALRRGLARGPLPRHVALIMDGNRRWARMQGHANPSVGHRYGAEHVEDVLQWCGDLGIDHVTVWVASADNLAKRSSDEVAFLMQVAEDVIAHRLARPSGSWRLHLAGDLDLLPASTAIALKEAREATLSRDVAGHLTVAIGYDGRTEILEAVRSILEESAAVGRSHGEAAASVTEVAISAHLYNPSLPDPDLIIRTSGEQRLSDFMLWQGVGSELYFCDVYWPGFRHVDFLRALRTFGARRRRATR